jgi:uncharacterized protein
MIKRLFVLSALALTLIPVHSQLLWKITGNGLKKPSYLFGTHHLISIQYLDSVPGLYKAFNECEKVVGEISTSNVDAATTIQEASIMPNGTMIDNLLTAEQYNVVDKELKAVAKIGLKQVAMMNPTLILTIYEAEIFKKMTGFSDNNQSDSYLQLVAFEKGKAVEGLETVEEQINILYKNGTLKRQAELLYETVLHKDSVLSDIKTLNTLYKQGNIEELYKLTLGTGKKHDFTEVELSKILYERNEKWATKLSSIMPSSPCFIAVGAAHLGGKRGVIKLLQKQGFTVKPVQ